ncbi:MAG: hypothetical protein OZSIB_3875 [Candidatus Ozemobacter sibiricus]|uniref:Uncharacterized protein n=1 Tax=Candidatus Ozemobacter sibiricus TaxID=2268124 RepID=A0A367ZPN5_9BACT|nr:MAG: hypothetical protein OZSIB_3875 [Candidatus Ozemobacter sibiricus]
MGLLVQAGFEVRCTLAPGAEHWLPPEPIRLLTGAPPVAASHLPSWPGGGQADLGVAVVTNAATWLSGAPQPLLPASGPEAIAGFESRSDEARRRPTEEARPSAALAHSPPAEGPTRPPSTEAGPLPRQTRGRSAIPWLLVAPGADEVALPSHARPPWIIGVVALPALPTTWPRKFEEVLARLVRSLRQRAVPDAAPPRVSVQHLVPAPLATASDRPPRWVDDLRHYLALAGVELHEPGPARVDLLILTYGGPFLKAPAPARSACGRPDAAASARRRPAAIQLSFAAVHAPLPMCHGLTVPFFTPATPAEELADLTRLADRPGRVLPVVRSPDGTLTVYDRDHVRVFPELTAQPALERLVEHLLAHPLTSPVASPTI